MKYLNYYESYSEKVMKTIKKFKAATKKMTLDDTVDFVIENCQDYLNNPIDIYRSINAQMDYFYCEPVRRYSRDNDNYYNLIMDNAPQWKDFPKRNKSFMASLKNPANVSNDYSYFLIPLDGAKFGVAPQNDIFQSFRVGSNKIFDKNIDIDTFFRYLFGSNAINDTNYRKFKQELKIYHEQLKSGEIKVGNILQDGNYLSFSHISKTPLIQTILDMMDPTLNDFHSYDYHELCKFDAKNSNEVWTDRPCIFVNEYNSKTFNRLVFEKDERLKWEKMNQ